jgi:methylenetetrahydrofolate dehydrogenase (NAD+)
MTKQNECIRVNATKVAEGFIEELRAILSLFEGEFRPKLVGYLANNDASALTYAQWTAKSCQSIGIDFELVRVKREQLEDTLLKANEDDSINGIMVYYPVFGGGHDQYIQSCLSAYKDVEGLCHLYRFNMYHNIRYVSFN